MSTQLKIEQEWTSLLNGDHQAELVDRLEAYLPNCRWFQSKARKVEQIRVIDAIPLESLPIQLVLLEIQYANGADEIYMLPIKFISGEVARDVKAAFPIAEIVNLQCQFEGAVVDGMLIDALYDERFRREILNAIGEHHHMEGAVGSLEAGTTRAFDDLYNEHLAEQSKLLGKEQSNTSIKYGDVLVLKLMRRLEEGVNPELEIGRFLTEETDITHVPLLAGYMEYRQSSHPPVTVAVLQKFVENQGDAWEFTIDWLSKWLQSGLLDRSTPDVPPDSLIDLAEKDIPEAARQNIGDYLDKAYLLGRRTAEMHVALASGTDDKFGPVEFSMSYQKELYDSIEKMSDRIFSLLRDRLHDLPEAVVGQAQEVLEHEEEIRETFSILTEHDIPGKRIRGHGDYHLGQVLYTGDDFVIVDFEGEPARPLAERYIKRSPLRDVAGMLRSFHYAAYGTLPGFGLETAIRDDQREQAEPWALYWRTWVSVAFLQGYLKHVKPANILPPDTDNVDLVLRILTMEKAVYELGYEINNRPGWLKVPAQAMTRNA